MCMKHVFLFPLFFIYLCSSAQLATVRTPEPQKSTFKTLGYGLNLHTNYDDDNIRYYQFHEVIEYEEGFYKVGLNANSGYQKKGNLSIHVITMNKDLQITQEMMKVSFVDFVLTNRATSL